MLIELGILPEVLAKEHSPEERVLLKELDRIVRREGIVHDFGFGKWKDSLLERQDLPLLAKKLLEQWGLEGRLWEAPSGGSKFPNTDSEWRREVQLYSSKICLTSIIAIEPFPFPKGGAQLTSLSDLIEAPWRETSQSTRTYLKSSSYNKLLKPIVEKSFRLTIIDPYLNPDGYITELLPFCTKLDAPIHVHIPLISPGERRTVLPSEAFSWKEKRQHEFSRFDTQLKRKSLRAEIHLWDHFHDRFIITNLLGIHMGKGLSINDKVNEITTWSKLSKLDREAVEREFDSNSGQRTLKYKFTIGKMH